MDTNTLFGALVGGLCSISATMLGHWYQNKKERRINRAIILDCSGVFGGYKFEGRYVENITTSRIQQK